PTAIQFGNHLRLDGDGEHAGVRHRTGDRIGLGVEQERAADITARACGAVAGGIRAMTLGRLWRILWGRRLIVLTPTICTLLGGLVVILTFPPRYEATTRVILDIIKPDPVTGFQVSDKMHDAYVASEINMLRTDEVTGAVVQAMGWLENPDMVAAWQSSPDKGDDLRRWAGRRLAFSIGAEVVPDTNILEIKFDSTAPDLAKLVADNIR